MQTEKTEGAAAFMAAWKKKLFVAAAYLLVAALLLVFVSYGQYKIKINADLMYKAATMQAQISLAHSFDNHSAAVGGWLADLQPGDKASEACTAGDANRKIGVTISNHADATGEQTEVDMKYTLRITSAGRLPLEFVLKDGTTTYTSVKSGSEYKFVDGSGNEAEFSIGHSGDIDQNYEIYVGWDNTSSELTDASYRKEVDVLEIRADVRNDSEPDYTFTKTEEELNTMIPTTTHTVN